MHFLAIEWAAGEILEKYAKRQGPLPVDEVSAIVSQIADAVHAAHAVGIVHRDLKPDNVMYDPATRQVKLLDFGIATDTDIAPEQRLTRAGFFVGTLMYVAPEALSGELVGPLADQYSLATIAYFLLTGCLPFPAKTPREMFSQLLSQPPIPLNQAKAGLKFSPAVEAVIMRGLSKEPSKRYPDVLAFAARFPRRDAAAVGRRQAGLRREARVAVRSLEEELSSADALGRAAAPPASRRLEIGGMDRQPQRERRAFAELTVDADVAAEQLREPARDREAESRAALHRVAARAGVHLLELVEDARLIVGRDADAGVDDLQRDPRATRVGRATRERRILGRVRVARRRVADAAPTSRARTAMPPAGVYFTALPIRLTRICRRCVGSVRTRGSDAPTAIERLRPRSLISDSSSLAMLSTNDRSTMRFADAPRGGPRRSSRCRAPDRRDGADASPTPRCGRPAAPGAARGRRTRRPSAARRIRRSR